MMSSPKEETVRPTSAEPRSAQANTPNILLPGQGGGDIPPQLLLLQHKQALLQQQRQQQEQLSALDQLLAQNQQPNATHLQLLLQQQQQQNSGDLEKLIAQSRMDQQQQHVQLASLLASGSQGGAVADASTYARPSQTDADQKVDDAGVEGEANTEDDANVATGEKKDAEVKKEVASNQVAISENSKVPHETNEDLENDTFPFKLFRMLAKVEEDGKQDIVSFTNNDRAFIIHKPHRFTNEIMPEYFTTTRMSSFQRQLNLYGFRRITEGPNKGAYYHEFFQKGKLSLCNRIKRKKNAAKPPPNWVFPAALGPAAMNLAPGFSVRQILSDPSALLNLQGLGMAGLAGLTGAHFNLAASQPNANIAALLALQQQKEQVEALQQLLLNQQRQQR